MIPKIIHFVWLGGQMPQWAADNVRRFGEMNPGHEVLVHTDDSGLLPGLRPAYAACDHQSSRADLLRISVLFRAGGWYFDVDMFPVRPLSDAENAFCLDGRKVYLSRQNIVRVPINNCVMASGPKSVGLQYLIEAVGSVSDKTRTAFGPDLASMVATEKPSYFVLSNYEWYMPCNHESAWKYYQHAVHGRPDVLRNANTATGGQLPFALHLWLHNHGEQIAHAYSTPPDLTKYTLVEKTPEDHCMNAVSEGLAKLGYQVERYDKCNESILNNRVLLPEMICLWNNRKRARLVAAAAALGVQTLVMENGFFDRKQYVQLDHAGFLHWSSWRRQISHPAPDRDRLGRFYRKTTPVCCRRGYVLVLGQVGNDTQMADSEITGPVQLQRRVAKSMPDGVPVYFRPHPQVNNSRVSKCHQLLPVMQVHEASAYEANKQGLGLTEALSGAAFVVTINSNSINEALAAGVPVLAFGPHLGIEAGVVKPTSSMTLKADIKVMLGGWLPDQAMVENYLHWLACRQWNYEELAGGEVLKDLLRSAGVIESEIAEEVIA